MNTPFVHLRTHSEYSVKDSTLRLNRLIELAKEYGQPAIALTDRNSMAGAIQFIKQALSSGIQPIVGVDIQLDLQIMDSQPNSDQLTPRPSGRVVLIAKNYQGYLQIMDLLSKGYTENLIHDEPVLLAQWLKAQSNDNILCLSGDETGLIGAPILSNQLEIAEDNLKHLQSIFSTNNLFMEVQRRGTNHETQYVHGAVEIADRNQIPLIATHPIQFESSKDYFGHEIKVCNQLQQTLYDVERPRLYTPYQYFTSSDEMQDLFSDLPDALENSSKIAQLCNLQVPLDKPVLPPFIPENGMSLPEYFKHLSRSGLEQRLLKLYPDSEERNKRRSEYEQRLEYEIEIILNMGFDGYFMIVADFIQWGKKHGVPIGPGRGSGAGSLVAYSLQITDLDPLKYGLLFERFLNPERVSMPDFDIDFCQEKRQLVIDYVTKKYGEHAVAGISTSSALKARAALRAAGRAFDMPLPAVDSLAKLIPDNPAAPVTLSEAIDQDPLLKSKYQDSPEIRNLFDGAMALEGLPNTVGQHAAGVVISPTKISDYSPLYMSSSGTQAVTQYDKDDVEKAGLVKFDFLGLKTLTKIDYALNALKTDLNIVVDPSSIPLDDTETLKTFQRGDSHAIFQFESGGMKDLLKKASPDRFEDLVALVSLYRPGPMDFIPDYIARKHGQEEVSYVDPRLKPILSETYGIMVYQEQVMQIARVIGGYTPGGADSLRKAMGKKLPEEMVKHRSIFIEGAIKNGMQEKIAAELFDTMAKFAGYGFNKSHAAAYAYISFQTAYLKTHYPAAFYAAEITIESDDTDSIPPLLADARSHGVSILPADINYSDSIFRISLLNTHNNDSTSNQALRYGLSGLKGVGRPAANLIVQERELNGPYTSLYNFTQRNPQVNSKVLSALINSGAFDALHPNRAESLAMIPVYAEYNKKILKIKKDNKEISTTDDVPINVDSQPPGSKQRRTIKPKTIKPIPDLPEWVSLPNQELLVKLENEMQSYGFYFSDHPYKTISQELGGLPFSTPLSILTQTEPNRFETHVFCGVVSSVEFKKTKRGKMALINISDGTANITLKGFAELSDQIIEWCKPRSFVMGSCKVQEDSFSPSGVGFIASELKNKEETKMLLAESLHISVPIDQFEEIKNTISELNLHEAETKLPVYIWHPTDHPREDGRPGYVKSKNPLLFTHLSPLILSKLEEKYGSKFVKLRFRKDFSFPKPEYKPRHKR